MNHLDQLLLLSLSRYSTSTIVSQLRYTNATKQIKGKRRGEVQVPTAVLSDDAELERIIRTTEIGKRHLGGESVKKIIVAKSKPAQDNSGPNRVVFLANFVI